MTLGRLGEPKRLLCDHIASAMTDRGVPARLANRIAFQLVLKCEPAHLGSLTTWQAMGDQVHAEVEHLRRLGLVDRQIIVALPKLAATQVDALLEELRVEDPTIARTILNVALDAAEPVQAAQRYLREFHRVVAQLKTLDPSIARTIANATFMARTPTRTATVHYKRFAQLYSTFHDDVAFARTVAKTACRSTDPLGVAERVIAAYHAARRALAAKGAAPKIARSLAGIASVATEPMPTTSSGGTGNARCAHTSGPFVSCRSRTGESTLPGACFDSPSDARRCHAEIKGERQGEPVRVPTGAAERVCHSRARSGLTTRAAPYV